MDIRKKIIDDPLFTQWVFKPTAELNTYWEQYIREHPQEYVVINELINDLRKISIQNEDFSLKEKQQIASRFKDYLFQQHKHQRTKQIVYATMRYAAVAVLFSCISGLAVYFVMKKPANELPSNLYAAQAPSSHAVIYFSDQEAVKLDKKNSSIQYTATGEVLMNGDSLIEKIGPDQEPVINRLVVPYGDRSKIALADGTIVWLNAGSQLIYPSFFAGKQREVTLYGEALFEVRKDEQHPFIVKTAMLDVRVLGTIFNVSAYNEDHTIQTVLKEGKVAIREHGALFFDKDIVLQPSQMALFNKANSEMNISKVNTDDYIIWAEGLLSFNNTEINRVIPKIERYFNIRLILNNPSTGEMKINGKLNLAKDINEVLDYLSQVSLSSIEKTGENTYVLK
ncbi:MAG: FecR domain-containing protein [Prolixibacteraceae bacterium]|nr:FecR domain-containing protein [Prolixibacteraceae bacterium]